jgi:hypothetical protein
LTDSTVSEIALSPIVRNYVYVTGNSSVETPLRQQPPPLAFGQRGSHDFNSGKYTYHEQHQSRDGPRGLAAVRVSLRYVFISEEHMLWHDNGQPKAIGPMRLGM